ncbi:isocitrate lyase/phosphoenolpyruvate mutase family protein [Agriterribacter sp.]|uniref:isocitrate lyase/PEP mutase family protein n=1 Tax=Agriterribacter sp. TaxID=2821509 RepID=UPI002C55B951|nr:isocitrate lyase/phosphoenolpyruvate mutase family protein [Agriterribacter sp.]HRO45285.1 isocitrate lyase/phosphoenolpyruvate mutase family protein [Agriterribacter sp.]HRQ19408.1 isocitrate lyase/phosphoenolpyruvate mutase family protein [Agriterribacter sp.]
MPASNIQPSKGSALKQLHHNGKLLVLPNIWDPLGAALLESTGYPAIATASASIAFSHGYPDGEKIPFNDLLRILQKIVNAVAVPVTADIESGYAKDNNTLTENIKKLADTGIAGINIEDTRHDDHRLLTAEAQCERISRIKQTASAMGMPLFINARTDIYLNANHLSAGEKLAETIRRGKAYKDAGADGFYPIFLKTKEDIEAVIKSVALPVNILLLPGIPDAETLQQTGVARLSLGPGFLKTAIHAMKNTAEKLLQYEGMDEVKGNPVTTAYINSLIVRENASG